MKSLKKITTLFTLLMVPFITANAFNGPVNDSSDEKFRTIEIEGSDQMKFNVTEINAVAGETVEVTFTVPEDAGSYA